METSKLYSFDGWNARCKIEICIENGGVTKCYYRDEHSERVALKEDKNFEKLLKHSLEKLVKEVPSVFDKVFKSLCMDTREFKVAKKIRDVEIARLRSTIKLLGD